MAAISASTQLSASAFSTSSKTCTKCGGGHTGVCSARTSLPSFSGLKATSKAAVSAAPLTVRCVKCNAVRSEACDHTGASANFASVSTSTAPAAPAPLLPSLIGAGLIGAAGFAVFSGGKSEASSSTNSFLPDNGAILPHAKSAAPAAIKSMAINFPNAIQEETFIQTIAAQLSTIGFRRDNCIALINTCRDEVCRPLVNIVDREFGLSFNISGLGGLINAGKTGFGAGMAHSPEFPCDRDGSIKERYIFLAFPHVSVGETGEVGSLLRRGRGKASNACGALIAIKGDIAKGGGVMADELDGEYVLLKKKVINKLPVGKDNLSLTEVTKAALSAITEDLERLISLTVDPKKADYAVITGIQIHSGNQIPGEPFRVERTCDYIAPDTMYAVVSGEKYALPYETSKTVSALV